MLLLLLACFIGDPGPATPGSPAGDTQGAQAIAEQAAAIEAMAIELEEEVLKARELTDAQQRRDAAQDIAARMKAIEEHNRLLKESVKAYGEQLTPSP